MADLQNTRVLVTGADGFTGSHLTEEFGSKASFYRLMPTSCKHLKN